MAKLLNLPENSLKPNKVNSLIYQPSVVTYDDTVKCTYTYDNGDNNITQITQGWSNNNWINEELYYDHNQNYIQH